MFNYEMFSVGEASKQASVGLAQEEIKCIKQIVRVNRQSTFFIFRGFGF
jgi:hypothetical protein